MDENRITGTPRNLGGKVEEGVGRVTGDAKAQVRGMADQAAGAAQDLYGQARDTAALCRVVGKVATQGHRDSALHRCHSRYGPRLVARPDASAFVNLRQGRTDPDA